MNEIKGNNFNLREMAKIIARNIREVENYNHFMSENPNIDPAKIPRLALLEMPYAIDTVKHIYFSNWSGITVVNDYTMGNSWARSDKISSEKRLISWLKQTR